ncbi:MAG: DUF3426 domain-containing protein [Lautropia sp.]
MALATTCPQCKTSFKVIPDQLKLRRGLVRCGVCQHVFSGIDYLRYVDDSAKAKTGAARSRGAAGNGGDRPAGSAAGPATRIAAAPKAAAPPAAPQTIISPDDELKTAFFLSDSTFGPYAQSQPQDVAPPRSIVGDAGDPPGEDFTRDFFREGTGSSPGAGPAPAHRPASDRNGEAAGRAGERGRSGGHATAWTSSPGGATSAGSALSPFARRGGAERSERSGDRGSERDRGSDRGADRGGDRGADRGGEPVDRNGGASGDRGGGAGNDRSDPGVIERSSGDSGRRARARSLLLDQDDDDPDVAAANALARQARQAYRQRSGRSSRSGSRSRGHGSHHGGHYETFGELFADPRRRYAVIALAVLIVLQLSLLFRSEIAARVPVLRPVLGVVAGVFGMSVGTPRSLASLTIESFELQTTSRPNQIALNAVLRNKDTYPVRWPAMELTLTDQASAVVVRKVILPADYLSRSASPDSLGARSEWPVRLNLDTSGLQLAGYSVALFYP